MVAHIDATYAKDMEFHIGFEGSFGDRHVNPRTLKSRYLGNLVCCEGIVTRCKLFWLKFILDFRYIGSSKSGQERTLLSGNKENLGKEIH